jgi:hypothetical protein
MFEALLGKIVGSAPMSERPEGAAFLKVARDLYQLQSRLSRREYSCRLRPTALRPLQLYA